MVRLQSIPLWNAASKEEMFIPYNPPNNPVKASQQQEEVQNIPFIISSFQNW